MDRLDKKSNNEISWMEKLLDIRNGIDQQKTISDAALCIVRGLKDACFDRVGIWIYDDGNGDDMVAELWGTDDYGNIYNNSGKFLSKDSIPPAHGYTIETDKEIIKEKLGIDSPSIFLHKDKDEDTFCDIWGYPPPCPGFYKRDVKGDNICLRTMEQYGKIIIIAVDNFISGRIIDHISASFFHLILTEMGKVLVDIYLKEALIQSEAKSRAILNAIPDLMFCITKDGTLTDYKDADQNELYVPKEEIIGSNIKNVLPSDVVEQTIECIRKTLDTGIMQVYEYKLSVPKGIRNYESRMVLNSENEVLAIIRDITDRKQMEENLRNSEERLKAIFEYAPDAYYLSDTKGFFIDGNKNAEKMIGYEKSELIGKSFLKAKLLTPSQIPKAAALLYKNVTGQATGPDEFTLRRKDGKEIPIEIRTVPIDIDGQKLVLGIARDISDRIKMEEELRKSEEKYRSIFRLSPEVILILDKKGNVIDINEKPQAWIGYKSEI